MKFNDDYIFYVLDVKGIQEFAEGQFDQKLNEEQLEEAIDQICEKLVMIKAEVISLVMGKT